MPSHSFYTVELVDYKVNTFFIVMIGVHSQHFLKITFCFKIHLSHKSPLLSFLFSYVLLFIKLSFFLSKQSHWYQHVTNLSRQTYISLWTCNGSMSQSKEFGVLTLVPGQLLNAWYQCSTVRLCPTLTIHKDTIAGYSMLSPRAQCLLYENG